MLELDHVEAWLIALMALFGGFWQLVVVPFLPRFSLWVALNPLLQYLFFNIGFLLLFISIVGVGFSFVIKKEFNFWYAVRLGLAGFVGLSLIYDLWMPPFAYNSCGQLLFSDAASLSGAAIDRVVGFVFESVLPFWIFFKIEFFGFCLGLKYVLVYFATPIIALVIGGLLVGGKDFVHLVFGLFGQK